jgi:DNA polymerase-3 subunit delta'
MFEEILGNEKAKQILEKSAKTNKTSHSYLFVGTYGIGKKQIAKEFAKMLLCIDENEKYCNKCKSCIEFSSNNNPDFFLIEPESGSLKIDQIREMQKRVAEKPIISNKKIFIIDDADLMTSEAQNCLLKTLEEPPEYATIILIGTNESDFLTTIKSRCTIMHFEPIENDLIKQYMQEKEGIVVEENMLSTFCGSIGKAIEITSKAELYQSINNVIKKLENTDIIEVMNLGEKIYKTKEEIFNILEYINVILLEQSRKNYKYANCINIVEETRKRIKANANYNMCIDYMLINIWEEVNEKHNRS